MPVAGKSVIVTGSAKGIGRYVAQTFAEAGAKVAVADVAPLENVTGDIKKLGAQVLAVPTDVRDEASVKALMARVAETFGGIDVIVNDAAIVPHFQWGVPRWPKVPDMEKSFFDRVMDTNLGGTFLCCKHVIPYMRQRGGGHIINFGQGSLGHGRADGHLVYAVSKLSIRAFTEHLAEEVREWNICAVSLGPEHTIATEEAPEEARQRLAAPSSVTDRYVQAANAPMEWSGKQLTMKDGKLAVMGG